MTKQYELPLLWELKPSKRLKRMLVSVHGLALVACAISYIPVVFKLAGLAVIGVHLYIIIKHFDRERLKKWFPVIIIFILHLIISTAWPITKFRYFVPVLPLVFLIALDQIYNIKIKTIYRNLIIILISASILSLSFLTYRSTPGHTYYNDGAITTGPFGDRAGEEE